MRDPISLQDVTMKSFLLCPFVFVVKDEKKTMGVNLFTASYVSVLSEEPPIIGVALRPSRYSHHLLVENGEFTMNLLAEDMLGLLDFCGSVSGKNIDKTIFNGKEVLFKESSRISTPFLEKSLVALECKVRSVLKLSEEKASHDFFMADVLSALQQHNFRIENYAGILTANYNYRRIGQSIGHAFQVWRR